MPLSTYINRLLYLLLTTYCNRCDAQGCVEAFEGAGLPLCMVRPSKCIIRGKQATPTMCHLAAS